MADESSITMDVRETFEGKTSVITGAASGIGEGIARVAAEAGMKVVLADVAEERLQRVVKDIRSAGGDAIGVVTDVTDRDAIENLADVAEDRYGEITLAVNNAGIESIGFSWEIDPATWDRVIDINLRGVIHGTRSFARRMISRGTEGFIANLSSVGGLGIMPTQTPYIMSKHAILSFSECVYLEMQFAEHPIHVSAVLPSSVRTRIFDEALTDRNSGFTEGQRVRMAQAIEHGLTIEEAGRRILAGIAARQFWVSTEPEATAAFAAQRARYLEELRPPALTQEMRYLLGE
ncbi:SDR family NAD(P)-dependent oxidoreductase [Croceicoccus sp. F390]|uniref:SDR family NAD(P)-dependent oxidoreductase n=1 Tax=Croceicoccus esteveae TaxID=3075597 RepID=A0ABU2ZNA0_9SPHN|nr:SDR family NAD(P)-dependent oxidoreductase [Croceicoccus sp. F390]MDT0577049.1 SDR family NAD(P)-dependent oxidoreductase [Croceicoccus sp. F390]